jgi:hypothetical protein
MTNARRVLAGTAPILYIALGGSFNISQHSAFRLLGDDSVSRGEYSRRRLKHQRRQVSADDNEDGT